MEKTMDKIIALAKARGFVYPGSEIYGGLANTWDYGNLGVELKNNVKRAWWQKFIQESPYNVGVDCAILMNPQGAMLKKIGSNARYEIERMLESKVNLKLWVKVKKDWRDSDFLIKNFGYDKKEI